MIAMYGRERSASGELSEQKTRGRQSIIRDRGIALEHTKRTSCMLISPACPLHACAPRMNQITVRRALSLSRGTVVEETRVLLVLAEDNRSAREPTTADA